jgi:hypothetical protein
MTQWRIAELTIRYDGDDFGAALPEKYRRFEAQDGEADLAVTLSQNRAPIISAGTRVFDSQSVWAVHEEPGGWCYTFSSPAFESAPYKVMRVDEAYSRAVVSAGVQALNGNRPHPLDVPLEQLLISHRLSHDGAVEVHGCGLDIDKVGVLLCGFSGAGKSTSARLFSQHCPRASVLSDDRVVLRRRGGETLMFGTPWHGEGGHALNGTVPLRMVCFLEHGAENQLLPVKPREAAQELFRRTFPPVWNRAAIEMTLSMCGDVALSVPVFRYAFRPDASSVDTMMKFVAML